MQPTTPSEPDNWNHDPDDLHLLNENDAILLAALESTRIAIARWTGGIHRPRMLEIGSLHVSPQARWYAKTCEDFEKWREDGGFGRDEQVTAPQDAPSIHIDSEGACMD